MEYSFRKKGSKKIIELSLSLSEREDYLRDHPDMEQVIVKAPALLDPLMLGRLNKEGREFQNNVVKRIRDTIPGNNLKNNTKFNIPKEI